MLYDGGSRPIETEQKMAGYRQDRINEEMRRELGNILRTLKDPRMAGMVSVVAAEVTRDLRYAKVHISVLGSAEDEKSTLEALKAASGYIRKEIGARLKLRATPELIFQADHSIAYGAHMNQLIQDVMRQETKEE